MSAVKNLRAMFEQKGETSPPERGRSPGIPPSIGSESPRPLSKVRTNFIAIEKDGRIGLQREPSQDSNISAIRKLSDGTDISTPPTKQENINVFADALARTPAKTDILSQPIPESPRTDSAVETAAPPPKPAEEAKDGTSTNAARKFKKPGIDVANGKTPAAASSSTSRVEAEPVSGTSTGKGKEKAVAKEDVTKPGTKTTVKATPKPLAVPSGSKPTARPAKSPTVSRAPRSPAETSTPKLPAKTPERTARQPEKVETPNAATSSANPPRSSSIKRPPALHPSPSGTGFVKPKVKSPTRPVKLPSSLTTHTAASGSKVNANRQSLSRSSGNLQPTDSLGRSPSRTSVSTVATTATRTTGTKSLKRQSSTVGRQRPSLGPPPKPTAKDHPLTKKEKEVDEGFLARMMRPTAASASKVNERVPTTPPRKPTVAATAKRQPAKADGKVIKKVIPKVARTSGSSTQEAESSLANQAALEVEQVATAEEDTQVAKDIEGEVTLPSDAGQQSTAQEIAPAVEQIANAEEAIEVARVIEGEVVLSDLSHEDVEAPETHMDDLAAEVKQLSLEDLPSSETPLVNGNHKAVGENGIPTAEEIDNEDPDAKASEETS